MIKGGDMIYDLEERTGAFGKSVIRLMKCLVIRDLNRNIIDQLLRSATSVGANYCEANGASSGKDFRNKIHICKKEIRETKYWIEMLSETEESKKNELRMLWKEAHELNLIFNKIASRLK
jgi:four helix bundle protein